MPDTNVEMKRDTLAKAEALAGARDPVLPLLAVLHARLAASEFPARSPESLLAAARSLMALAQSRPAGQINLKVSEGTAPARTVIEMVTDDMPFLLDSLIAAVAAEGLSLRLALHPIVAVERDKAGQLRALHERAAATPSAKLESMMRLEIATATEFEVRARLEANLTAALGDARAAVADWRAMRDAVSGLRHELSKLPAHVAPETAEETVRFLAWLNDDFFVFLGARDYRFDAQGKSDIVPGSGLGVLRDPSRALFEGLDKFVDLAAYTGKFLAAPHLVEISRSSERSRVLRAAPMDAIAVKRLDPSGRPIGLRVFLGLFTWHAYRADPLDVPLLSGKVERVLARSGAVAGSHNRRALVHIIESLPRDELFQIEEDQLLPMALGIRDLEERPRLGLFIRREPLGRFFSCFIYVPRERYVTELRQRFATILTEALDAKIETYHVALDEQALARVTFYLRRAPRPEAAFDVAAIERGLAEAARDWSDGLLDALSAARGDESAAALFRRYREAFPASYREQFSPETALRDIDPIELVAAGEPFAVALAQSPGASPRELVLKLFRPHTPMPLSDIVPLLEQFGLRIVAENPFEIALASGVIAYQQFVAESLAGDIDVVRDGERLRLALTRILGGEAEADGFNRLVIGAGLDWRQVAVLRLYARFLRQAGASFSIAYMEETLARHGAIAGKLAAAFEHKFDPRAEDSAAAAEAITVEIEHDLDQVTSLDDDRILRNFLTLMRQSLRTNYFQTENGAPKPYLAVKLASAKLELLPLPRPMAEIFVSSPWMEGVHLRAGKVARGGIRWSDRREDFRTEILGLMKAQVVKNAVIVPTGSKGGFIVKRPPADRQAFQEEGIRCYRTLLQGMLDLTDNVVDGAIVPPPDLVRCDGDDPYLVVAADKGTATFSDIANAIAVQRGFWLGDAFASGGSEGYDHKAMGITARGAWELVKRHFRERGHDIQSRDFTVVGVGDMSGDVFGNGMLRSRHIKLLAAFDHRHIFLDPDPDPARGFKERERMFALPRSSWADYDTALISAGGGVFPRTLKSIALSDEVRKRFGIEAKQLDPAALIRLLLTAPVDLLWFGGIGTFVKSRRERNADVGDRANDATRVDGADLRAAVVGEGANLGVTQLGRVEYAMTGGRIDTDSIDNSAGVDTSDREVNIKIALDSMVRAGTLDAKGRHEVLNALTDEVAALVLADNDAQGQALTLAETAQAERFEADVRLMRELEKRGQLNRAVDFLPDDETIAARAKSGLYLTRPELSIVLSHAKNALVDGLMTSDLPDDSHVESDLFAYFPPSLVARYRAAITGHRLRREIIATVAANELVNRGGIAMADELMAETGRDAGEVARAFAVVRGAFALDETWGAVKALDNKVEAGVQTQILLATRRLGRLATAWLLRHKAKLDIAAEIAATRPGVAALAAGIEPILGDAAREALAKRRGELAAKGVPPALARNIATFGALDPALAIVELALTLKRDTIATAKLFFATGAKLKLDVVIGGARALKPANLREQRAVESLVEDFYRRQAELARLAAQGDGALDRHLAAHAAAADHVRAIAEDIAGATTQDLARLVLASQALAGLAQQ
jgi:glutamate dehydrogenase